ncbi:MAG: CDGSH iron-sulfur domain-containing protein [Gammaproteobacteria bacterium]|nr:CDGSH iron-sulfur domain-containing protein [Gammaproteobacteria bacterium]
MSEKPTYPGNTIMVRPDGPLICGSDSVVTVQYADGNLIAQEKELALCRCGGSANKPFCDGSHKRNGFQAGQEFTDERREDIAGQGGELVITVKPNAMLSLKGPVTIFSRSGESVTTRSKGALCRCGASEKKPFCDASHKQCGFEG